MVSIYDQVEKMINEDNNRPPWVDEILFELREVKTILQNNNHKKPRDRDYFKFVNSLREKMRASIDTENYPEIYYLGRILGINFKGFIYDKESTKILPSYKAFKVYRFLYDHQKDLDKYLKL